MKFMIGMSFLSVSMHDMTYLKHTVACGRYLQKNDYKQFITYTGSIIMEALKWTARSRSTVQWKQSCYHWSSHELLFFLHYSGTPGRFPLTKIKPVPTWHFIISSTEWFIVCGMKAKKEENYIFGWARVHPASPPPSWKSSQQTIMSAVIDPRSPVSPAVKAYYLSDNPPLPAPQMLSNEAVRLCYLPSLKWKGKDVLYEAGPEKICFPSMK